MTKPDDKAPAPEPEPEVPEFVVPELDTTDPFQAVLALEAALGTSAPGSFWDRAHALAALLDVAPLPDDAAQALAALHAATYSGS